ncbi:hypothetical protein [Nitrobacter sp.]|uniref:hypothetical protein n=1 Tax=Nitrobacter sp. TaxID=29420 RepID=UPI003F64DB4F
MTDTPSSGAVLFHGLAKTPRSFGPMKRALKKEGFATLNLAYLSRKYPLGVLVENVHAAIIRLLCKRMRFTSSHTPWNGLLAQMRLLSRIS